MTAPATAARPHGWGLPDFALCWLAGPVAVIAVATVAIPAGARGDSLSFELALAFPAQSLATILTIAAVSRSKGSGSLRRDFGLTVRARDARFIGVGLLAQIVLLQLLVPILEVSGERDNPQALVRSAEQESGPLLAVLLIVSVVVLAPLIEELLFRGVLLRALLRRTSDGWAIFVSGIVFSAAHHIFEPGSFLIFPALSGLGFMLGWLAVRTGNLSRSIFVHAGFNLFTTIAILLN